jgi:eukaryotic-like serine/threonine-protein kinase
MSPDAAERLVAGRWMLHTALRRGPSGVIWRATEVADGRSLAVEELRLPARPDPEELGQAARWERVADEARTAAALDHPGLVRLDDVVVEDGVVYVAGELVDARTLDELIARHGPLPVRRVARLGLELLDALAAVHAAGLAHLDLRPACVLVTADGAARLAGVGLATLRATPGADRGTTAYLAPEQVRGDPAGPPADLWALGTILFLAVEGEPPFAADSSDATMAAILADRPRRFVHAGPLVPTLTALLTKPPGGRPGIPEVRHLLQPLTGAPAQSPAHPGAPLPAHPGTQPAAVSGASHLPDPGTQPAAAPVAQPAMAPGARHPPGPAPGPPEGERSLWSGWGQAGVHSPLSRLARHSRVGAAMDPLVRRVLLIAGGSVLLALVSFAVAVAVTGDPLGVRSQAVASTVATVPPTTTAAPPTTTPTTQAPLVPPGWSVHTDPATGYQVAVPPGWRIVSDGGPRTELRDQSTPAFLRIDWVQDPQADPVTLEQQAGGAHASERGGYQQARLEPAQFRGLPAALLEFTYQDGETWHALELGVRSPRHHVAMAIYTRDRDWGAGWALFEAFKASFVPPPT